jgi:hypothetical protein
MPPISQKLQAWLHGALLLLLSIDLTVLPQILPPTWAVKVVAAIGIAIGALKALLGLYAQRWNTDGTPQARPFEK